MLQITETADVLTRRRILILLVGSCLITSLTCYWFGSVPSKSSVHLMRFERTTFPFGGERSIQLSYRYNRDILSLWIPRRGE